MPLDPEKRTELRRLQPADVVGVILALGMAVALNLFIIGATLESYSNNITLPVGLSDNATQILGAWGSGIISVIGTIVGFRTGKQVAQREAERDATLRREGPETSPEL